MDVAAIAAIAALIVAIVALIIALAQALQQYFITGQSIRLCDSVVFGDMPGTGHRLWQTSQFRFRVVYSIPQISLPNDFWPQYWPVTFKERKHRLPNLSGRLFYPVDSVDGDVSTLSEIRPSNKMRMALPKYLNRFRIQKQAKRAVTGPRTGEAAWVSFCRVIHHSSWNCVRYDFVERDVDRCPSDLPTVPMPVSLRDVIIMALTVGMDCSAASFTHRSLSMQGLAGVLRTSLAFHPWQYEHPAWHYFDGYDLRRLGCEDLGHLLRGWSSP